MSEYHIAIIIKNLSYKEFDVEFKSLREDGTEDFSIANYKDDLIEIIDKAAQATFYKNNEGFSNRMTAAFIYFVEKVIHEQYYTKSAVILDVPWISQIDLSQNKKEIVEKLNFELDYITYKKTSVL